MLTYYSAPHILAPMPIPTPAREALDAIGIEGICDMISEGFSLRQMADKVGCTHGSIINWLAADIDRSARAKDARARLAQYWEEQAEIEIRAASDNLGSAAKARELAQHFRWRAAIINPQYRPVSKTEVSGPNGGPVQFEDTRAPIRSLLADALPKSDKPE